MTASTRAEPSSEDLEAQLRRVVDRAIARNIPGLAPLPQTESELDVDSTPKELVYSNATARLYHYLPTQDQIYRLSVLIVMQGHDIFMLQWVAPHRDQSHLSLENYVCDLLSGCIDAVLRDPGETQLTLVGYCMGGMMSCMDSALHPSGAVKNLACFTTPVNSDGMELYKRSMASKAFDIDRQVQALDNIPGDFFNNSLQALRPLQRSADQMKLPNNVDNDAFVKAHLRFDRWAVDQMPVPGELAPALKKDSIVDNKRVHNGLTLRGQRVALGRVKAPFLHVADQHDHIVPAAASQDLLPMIGSQDKHEIVMQGGHVALVTGGNAVFRL